MWEGVLGRRWREGRCVRGVRRRGGWSDGWWRRWRWKRWRWWRRRGSRGWQMGWWLSVGDVDAGKVVRDKGVRRCEYEHLLTIGREVQIEFVLRGPAEREEMRVGGSANSIHPSIRQAGDSSGGRIGDDGAVTLFHSTHRDDHVDETAILRELVHLPGLRIRGARKGRRWRRRGRLGWWWRQRRRW